jgi:pilus assembly protein Flp/PilA
MWLIDRVRRFVLDESGQDLVEYGLLATLIALVAMGAVQLAGGSLSSLWTTIATQMKSAA